MGWPWGRSFYKRFGDEKPSTLAKVSRLLAECALPPGKEGVDTAVKNFQASITEDTPPAEKLDVLAKLILLLGRESNMPIGRWPFSSTPKRPTKTVKTMRIRRRPSARRHRRRRRTPLERQARCRPRSVCPRPDARPRGNPPTNSFRSHRQLSSRDSRIHRHGQQRRRARRRRPLGRDVSNRKTKRPDLLLRGKLLELRGRPLDAARHLEIALRLSPGAPYESEARWLRALALEQNGRAEDAKKELARIVKSGVDDDFRKKAIEKLSKK